MTMCYHKNTNQTYEQSEARKGNKGTSPVVFFLIIVRQVRLKNDKNEKHQYLLLKDPKLII